MKKTLVSLFCVLALCLGLLPTAALAAGEIELYVAGQRITESGCYENQNGTWTKVDGTEPANGQFSYDAATATLTLNQAKIVNYQDVTVGGGVTYPGSVIAFSQSADVSLTIVVSQGTSNITGTGGIRVVSKAGDASLSISGPGSLEVNVDRNDSGISLIGSKNVNLNIDGADVKTLAAYYYGVDLHAGDGFKAAAVVNNGKLTAGGSGGIGIYYRWTNPSDSGTSSLTVSGNAVVDTRDSKILIASQASEVQVSAGSDGNGGIVFDGKSGTVYGNVTLDDPLTVGAGETLTIPEGSTLTVPEGATLTNDGTITIEEGGTINNNGIVTNNGTLTNSGTIVNKGTMDGNSTSGTGTVVTAPAITTESLLDGTAGQSYTTTLEATGNNITWSASGLPAGLTLDKTTGTISGTPTTAGKSTVTVTAANSAGSIEKTFTLNIKPATVSVTGVTLDTDKLDLYTGDSGTLTATVQPDSATDKTLTWSIDKPEIATVTQDTTNGAIATVQALKQGTATITVRTADGGYTATCAVTVTDKTYTLSADKTTLDFDAIYAGDAQPDPQTVTITNTGNQQVTVKLPIATNFDIAAGKGFENGSATIEPNGTATFTVQPKAGLAVGEYKEELTVSNQNAGEVKLTLTFKVNPVLVSGLTLNQNTLALFAGDSATLTAAVTPDNATNKTLTWASSNTAVATVDQSGKVTAVAPGTAAITVTTNDGSGKVASCPVTVTAKTYALTIDPAAIGFGTVQTGYTQPAVREITVRNTGNQTLTLTQPTATKYLVGSLSRLTLAPGETATFTVQPKADQPVAVYNETILVVGNGGAGASLNLSFTVEKASGTSSSGGASSSSSATTTTEKRTLHFDTNGGLPLDDVVRGLGAPVELWPYTPVRAGYLFQGWYADQALTRAVSSVVLTKDTTIYAKWAVDPAATAAPSGSGSGTGSSGSAGKGSGSQGGTTITVTPAPTASPTPTPEPTATPTPEPTATPEASAEPETDTDTASFPVVPVAAGVIVLVVLVGGITIYRRFHD